MAYEAGTAFLQIVPSFSGVVTAIADEATKWGEEAGKVFSETFNDAIKKGTNNSSFGPSDSTSAEKGRSAGGAFADAFRSRVDAALKALPDAKVGMDASEADRKIADLRARLETLRGVNVGVDISDTDALAAIDLIKADLDELGAKSPSASVRVNTGEASAKLAEIRAELDAYGAEDKTATAEIDTSGAISGVGGLAAAIMALGPEAVAAAAVATAALAAIPALIGGLGLAGGVALLGLAPVLKSLGTAPKAAAGGGGGAMNAAASAANSFAIAQLNAAHSAEAAARAVVTAENQVATAQYAETQAQTALTDARQAATDQLKSYKDQLSDGALAARQNALTLSTAQQQLATTQANPQSTYTQIAQAQLAVDQATQAIVDQQDQYAVLQRSANAAAVAGVDGATNVLQAQHNLTTSQQGVTTAQDAVTQAMANQQFQAQISALTLQQAAASAKNAGTSAGAAATPVSALGSAFTTLTPAGQSFVNFMKTSFLPIFSGLSATVQNNLLPGLQSGLTAMEPIFSVIGQALGVAAQGIGSFVSDLGQLGSSPKVLSEITTILADGNYFMGKLGDATTAVIQGFTNIGSQATPIVHAIGDGIVNLANAFLKWTEGPGFKSFVEWVQKNGPIVAKTLHDIFDIVGPLLIGAAQLGVQVFKLVEPFLKWVGEMLKAHPLIAEIVAGVLIFVGVMSILAPPILAVVGVIAEMSAGVAIVIGVIALLVVGAFFLYRNWGTIWGEIKRITESVWRFIENDVIHPLVRFFSAVIPPVLHAFSDVWNAVWGVVHTALSIAWDIMKVIFEAIVVIALVPLGIAIIVLRDVWAAVWPVIHGALTIAWSIMKPIFEFIVNVGLGALGIAIGVLKAVWTAVWPLIHEAVTKAWDVLGPVFGFIKTLGLDLLKGGIDVLSTAWGAFWSTLHVVVQTAWDLIRPMINFFIEGINALITAADVVPGVNIAHVAPIPAPAVLPTGGSSYVLAPGHNATGTGMGTFGPGLSWVGERGPELVNFGKPVQIIPNDALSGLGAGLQKSKAPFIAHADIHNEADLGMLMQKQDFLLRAGVL